VASPKPVKGVRTQVSDDLLWLPYILVPYHETYARRTAFSGRLIPFLDRGFSKRRKKDAYLAPQVRPTGTHPTINCVTRIGLEVYDRVVRDGLAVADRAGDWKNDGINSGPSRASGALLARLVLAFDFDEVRAAVNGEEHAAGLGIIGPPKTCDSRWNELRGTSMYACVLRHGTAARVESHEECRIDLCGSDLDVISGATERRAAGAAHRFGRAAFY